jgi:hypothetical protein
LEVYEYTILPWLIESTLWELTQAKMGGTPFCWIRYMKSLLLIQDQVKWRAQKASIHTAFLSSYFANPL